MVIDVLVLVLRLVNIYLRPLPSQKGTLEFSLEPCELKGAVAGESISFIRSAAARTKKLLQQHTFLLNFQYPGVSLL
jgi:hypothetical protein